MFLLLIFLNVALLLYVLYDNSLPPSIHIYMCNALYFYCPGSKLVVNIFLSSCLATRTLKAEITSKLDIRAERETSKCTM